MKSPNCILTLSSELLILVPFVWMSHPNSICKYQTPDLLDRSSCSLSIPSSIFPFLPVSQDRLLGIMLDFSLYFSYHMKSLRQTHFSSSQIHGEYFLFLLLPTLSTLDNLPSSLDFCSSPLPGLLLLHLPPSLCQHSSHCYFFPLLKTFPGVSAHLDKKGYGAIQLSGLELTSLTLFSTHLFQIILFCPCWPPYCSFSPALLRYN